MTVKDLINEVDEIKKTKPLSDKNKDKLRNVLSSMFDVIEKFEKGENIDGKSDKEKIDLLKNIISDMVKDEDQKKIIRGESDGK